MRTWIEQHGQRYVLKRLVGDTAELLGGNGPAVGEAFLCVKAKAGADEWRKPVVVAGREGRVVRLAEK
jgi:hypothetical protein